MHLLKRKIFQLHGRSSALSFKVCYIIFFYVYKPLRRWEHIFVDLLTKTFSVCPQEQGKSEILTFENKLLAGWSFLDMQSVSRNIHTVHFS